MTQEELEKLILENQASLARVEATVLKIKKKIFWQELAGVLKLILILGPLLLGLVYLTPYLKQYGNMMSGLLSGFDVQQGINAGSNGTSVLEMQEVLCNPNSQQDLIDQICN